MADNTSSGDKPRALSPTTKRTGQKRSLERGKSTRKKNPGKRAHKGGRGFPAATAGVGR